MNLSSKDHRPPLSLVLMAFATVYVVWGSTYFGIRYAVESIPPFLMGGSRFLFAGLALFLWTQRKKLVWPAGRQWRDATIAGTLMILGGNGGVTWAEKTIPSSVAALIVAIVPLWMVLLEWAEPTGRRPSMRVFGGLAIGFVGVAMLVARGQGYDGSSLNLWGVGAIIVSTITWSLGSLYNRRAVKPDSLFTSSAMQMMTGGFVMMLFGFGVGEGRELSFANVTSVSIWAWIYLTLIGSLAAFTAYVWLLQVSTPSKVSTTAFVNPLIAVVLGCTLGAEPFTSKTLFSAALILAAVVLIIRGAHRTPRRDLASPVVEKPAERIA